MRGNKRKMKKIKIRTLRKKISGDLLTPVSIYLKVRDLFAEPLLLESSDYHSGKNSKSFICFAPLASILVDRDRVLLKNKNTVEKKSKAGSINEAIENFV